MQASVGDRAILQRDFPGRSGDRARVFVFPDSRAKIRRNACASQVLEIEIDLPTVNRDFPGLVQIEIEFSFFPILDS